jgi:hypothetical protein
MAAAVEAAIIAALQNARSWGAILPRRICVSNDIVNGKASGLTMDDADFLFKTFLYVSVACLSTSVWS